MPFPTNATVLSDPLTRLCRWTIPASSESLPCATATNAPAPILRSFFKSYFSYFHPSFFASFLMRLQYKSGVSSFGGKTVSSRQSILPSALLRSNVKPLASLYPCKIILASSFLNGFFLLVFRDGSIAPFTHVTNTANSASFLFSLAFP